MPQAKLTAIKVEKIKPDPGKRIEVRDLGKPGLFLIVQPSGKKSWAVRYRRQSDGRSRKYTLKGFPSLAVARQLAQRVLDRISEGHDPASDKQTQRQQVSTVDVAFRLFLDKHVRTRKGRPVRESSHRELARLLGYRRDPTGLIGDWVPTRNGPPWPGRALQSITAADVRALLEQLVERGPVMANRTLGALRQVFAWHVRRDPDLLARNPCDGIDHPAPENGGRDRVLNDRELVAVWRSAEQMGWPYGTMVQVLALSGCRRDEVREAMWSEFDLKARLWHIPGHRTKNGRDHMVPITDTMADLLQTMPRELDSRLLFSLNGRKPFGGLSGHKRRLDQLVAKLLGAAPPPFVLHDLRRTFVTGLQRLRFPLEVAEACVNHASGTVSGVAAVYARHDHADEKREALSAWSRHVVQLVNGEAGGTVVPMRRAKIKIGEPNLGSASTRQRLL